MDPVELYSPLTAGVLDEHDAEELAGLFQCWPTRPACACCRWWPPA